MTGSDLKDSLELGKLKVSGKGSLFQAAIKASPPSLSKLVMPEDLRPKLTGMEVRFQWNW